MCELPLLTRWQPVSFILDTSVRISPSEFINPLPPGEGKSDFLQNYYF